ncbi:MAG: hypothetical protein A2639_01635 [Candidatus Staskawiczbacteria bacterium RIFCSPHIGHO2_01_FULL_34_27]|uniref:Uncharacterized protein n=1 Tax=Candidatus Staskawiczbacteria bacterium RIFCSPHIGHO2_01_FULL_34_27 TaxID=1802199 RepID=A0A1G2HKG6_9BACT|nr:MAG: hypothetical protein A2639_01635 [Candidatus Staskawiczbacteria bacterium RIFCSPHIGHO2_01_FULL_34_27]
MENQKMEEVLQLLVEQKFGINKKQKKFLDTIKGKRVIIHANKKGSESKEFQELTNLLFKMHENGFISKLEIIQE